MKVTPMKKKVKPNDVKGVVVVDEDPVWQKPVKLKMSQLVMYFKGLFLLIFCILWCWYICVS